MKIVIAKRSSRRLTQLTGLLVLYVMTDRRVTGFTNSEEQAVELTDIVPMLVEDMLKANGGKYGKGDDWSSFVVTDGKLVTSQNPASSTEAAQQLLALL